MRIANVSSTLLDGAGGQSSADEIGRVALPSSTRRDEDPGYRAGRPCHKPSGCMPQGHRASDRATGAPIPLAPGTRGSGAEPAKEKPLKEGMLCPVCRVDLVMSDRQGIEIDYCPKCRGVWLGRGELDKIIERSAAYEAPAQAAPPAYSQ